MAHVQLVRSTPQTSVTSLTGSIDGVTAGSTLLCVAWLTSQNRSVSSITDSLGDTWVRAVSPRLNDGGAVMAADIYICENAQAGDHDLTAALDASGSGFLTMVEEDGVEADSWSSGQATGAGGYSSSLSSGSITPSQADCVVYGFCTQYDVGTPASAPGGSWTDLGVYTSGNYGSRVARQEPGSTSAISVTFAIGGGGSPVVTHIVALAKSSGGGSTQPIRTYYSNRRRRL